MELGIYTFAEATPDPSTGHLVPPAQRLRDLVEEIELADEVGLDVFGVATMWCRLRRWFSRPPRRAPGESA